MYWSYPYAINYPGAQVAQQRQERNFSEDLLQANVGKRIIAYMTFDASKEWPNKVFYGVLRQVGRDYFVIRDQETGKDTMLLNINLNWVVFEDTPARLAESP
ncbi:MAG: spore coat protein GerQ [Thermoactinomyces sp.]